MSDAWQGGGETPFDLARRLHVEGRTADQVVQALTALGLDLESARIAARAGRGEAGIAPGLEVTDAPSALDAEPPATAPAHPCPAHPQWPVTGTCTRCGAFFCHRCLRDAGLTRAPANGQCAVCVRRPDDAVKAGIGGWLLLPAFHVTLTPLVQLFAVAMLGLQLSVFAIGFTLLQIAYSIFTAVYFFACKRVAMPLMLGFYGLNVVTAFVLHDAQEGWVASAGRSVLSSLVWSAYFLTSKRVAATFTR